MQNNYLIRRSEPHKKLVNGASDFKAAVFNISITTMDKMSI